jgi:hypothetical protein
MDIGELVNLKLKSWYQHMAIKRIWGFFLLVSFCACANDLDQIQLLRNDIVKSYVIEKVPSLDCVYGSIKCSSNDIYDLILYKKLTFTDSTKGDITYKFKSNCGDKSATEIIYEIANFRESIRDKSKVEKYTDFLSFFDGAISQPILVEKEQQYIRLIYRVKSGESSFVKFKLGNISDTFLAGKIFT